jgi:hypothetical protein
MSTGKGADLTKNQIMDVVRELRCNSVGKSDFYGILHPDVLYDLENIVMKAKIECEKERLKACIPDVPRKKTRRM